MKQHCSIMGIPITPNSTCCTAALCHGCQLQRVRLWCGVQVYGGQMGVRPNAVSGASSFPGARPAQPAASPAFPSMAGVSSLAPMLSKSFPMNCRVYVAAYIAPIQAAAPRKQQYHNAQACVPACLSALCSQSQPKKRIVSH